MKFSRSFTVIILIVLAGSTTSMMKSGRDDHSRCGRPAVSQRQPRSTGRQPRPSTGRIFNGKPSRRGSWPWQVSLQLLHPKLGFIGHWCGGVLIDSKWILTAAHCVHNELFNLPIGALWTAVLGEWELDSGGRGSVRLPVERVILHERFNNYVHDIALMKLSRPAPLSKVVRIICLPEAKEKFTDVQCVASGWGRSGPSPSLSSALLEASVPLLNLEECKKAYGQSVPIRGGHLCAGHTDGSSGSCVIDPNPHFRRLPGGIPSAIFSEDHWSSPLRIRNVYVRLLGLGSIDLAPGDSGGPLQCRRSDGDWLLVGITSFGSGCARPGYPDVYTRVQHYLTWIKDTMSADTNT